MTLLDLIATEIGEHDPFPRRTARRILRCMREPSEAMVAAAYRKVRFAEGTAPEAWQAMIDAALTE